MTGNSLSPAMSMSSLRSVLAGLLCTLFLISLAPASLAQDQAITVAQADPAPVDPLVPVERPIEDELILQLQLGRWILSDAMLGYLHRGGVLLGLTEITRALDFPIDVDPIAGQASGWFLRENRGFALDLVRREVIIEGELVRFPDGLVELGFDDIYVDSSVLADWFPVDFDYDLSRLLVTLKSREPLPLEERLAREKTQARLGRGSGTVGAGYDRLEVPYAALDLPFVDTSWAFTFDGEGDGPGAASTTTVSGDFLYATGTLFVAGNENKTFSDARLTLDRKDPDRALLGPIGVSEFALDDVFTPQLPLIAGQREGRGATFSTYPLGRSSEFDVTTLRGDLPLGWDVELYRNEVLVDFQTSGADGRYEFTDVPLLFGANLFTLEFYGPQGQRRTESERFFIGEELVKPGERNFRFAVNQQDASLLPVDDETVGFADPDDGEYRLFGDFEVGLSQALSMAGGAASYSLDGERHNYAALGLRASVLDSFFRFGGVADSKGGGGLELSAQTRFGGLALTAEHDQLFALVSERFVQTDDRLSSATTVRLDGAIPETALPRIPFNLTADLERRRSGRYDARVSNRLSAFFAGVVASNTLDFELTGGGDAVRRSAAGGSALVNSRLGELGMRGQLSYSIDPVAQFDAVSITGDYRFDVGASARMTVDRTLSGTPRTSLSAGLFYLFDTFDLGFTGSVTDDGSFNIGLTISYGAGLEPRAPSLVQRARGIADSGAVSALAYLDLNQNQIMDGGDEPIAGARFQGHRDIETDEDGIAFLTGLGAYQPTDIALDTASLADPFWLPLRNGVEIVPRPGKTVLIDFPVTPTGEIDGTVFLDRGGNMREVSNVALELVDVTTGAVVASERSQFDGFYLFELVPPGRYEVRVSPDQVSRLKLATVTPVAVEIGTAGDVAAGIDFVLRRAGEQ